MKRYIILVLIGFCSVCASYAVSLLNRGFHQVSVGVSGCIYVVDANDDQYIPFKNIPCARLGIVPLEVKDRIIIDDAYEFLQDYVKQGRLKVGRYEDKTSAQLTYWYKMVADTMREKNMLEMPDCSYAKFVRNKLPKAWEMLEHERD